MTVKKSKEARPRKSGPVGRLTGFKDQLPLDSGAWEYVLEAFHRLALDYGFTRIDTPILEEAELFEPFRENGAVYDKHLITFTDPDGNVVALRPESTVPLARAYREHGLGNQGQPVKLYYLGPQFRFVSKPGGGTQRQFTQFGLEVFGDPQPVVDAQLIAAVYFFFSELNLSVRLHISSLGHSVCRAQYEKLLAEFFRPRRAALCELCKDKLAKQQVIRLLECREAQCIELFQEAPQIVDHLCEEDRTHFMRVLEHLDEVEISYILDPRLLRDRTFANRTIVEFYADQKNGTPLALAGGGRHDELVALTGGQPTPAFGLAGGVERVLVALREQGRTPPPATGPDAFLAQLGDSARRKSLQLFIRLRQEGIRVAENLSKEGIKGQLEMATRLRAKFSLILGQKEIMDGTILIRDMENGIQEVVDFQKIIPELKKRLAKFSSPIPPTPTSNPNTTPNPQS